MIWTTTGNLTNVKNNAKFDFGVAMLPAGKQRGSPTGGGNFYLFEKSTPAQREAAFKFIKWVTTPQRAAQWGIDTGYVAVRADAWDTPVMKKYVAGFPAGGGRARPAAVREGGAVDARQPARDQGAERRAAGGADRHQDAGAGDEGRAARGGAAAARIPVTASTSAVQAVRAGAADPPSALNRGPIEMHRMTRRANGSTAGCCCCRRWRCSCCSRTTRRSPTLWHSFFSTPKGSRPAVFVGARQLPAARRRPDLLAGAGQQPLVRARHDPAVDRARAR